MLNFTYASVLMAIFTSALLIVILTLIFLNESLLYKFGFSVLNVFCVLIFIRMALPFELTNITKIIKFHKPVSKLIGFILHPRFVLFEHTYSIWELFVFIWCIVFIVLFLKYIHSIKKMHDFVQSYGTDITDDYSLLIGKLCTKEKLHKRISVIRLPLIPSPSVLKYGLNYYILMPKNLELSEEETELVFIHELSHITHHDLTLKFLVQTLCLFYWWNPFCALLKRQSNLLFELRVDSSIVSQGHDKIRHYLACLLKVKEYSVDNKSNLPLSSTISLLPKKSSVLHKRLYFLMEDNPKKKYLAGSILIPVCIIYLASFIFIFEGYHWNPEDKEGEILNSVDMYNDEPLNSTNIYIVKNNENKYDIYFNGIYAETVNSLKNYPKNCKIYLSLEEAQKNEED